MEDVKVLQLTPDVQWIGVLDPDLVTFDVVMETRYGTTYNSYFINARKKTIIETVKRTFWENYLEKIKKVVDPSEIQYIILDHTEPDHSGSLPELLKIAPEATVVGSGNAIRYLSDQLGFEFKNLVVKDGDRLSLGDKTLHFVGAPNLHWPDSIYTWLEEDSLLFTCDSFGCHYSHPGMFDSEVGDFDDAFSYYFNVILKPYSKFMLKAINKIRPLPINMICPGHGPILRDHWLKYVDWSEEIAQDYLQYPLKNRILIAYVSAYRNTAVMAAKIAQGIRDISRDLEVDLFDLEGKSLEEVEKKVTEANAILVGSPIINQNILLQVYQLFAVMNPIRDRGKLAGAFGSYGWSGEFVKNIETNLMNLKLKYIGDGVFARFTPHQQQIDDCYHYGRKFAGILLEEIAKCSE
jgi:flavorubredoxin